MLVVAGLTAVSDNIIRPLTMMSGDNGLHPFISLLAVIGGVIAYGIPGLLLGPLIASICFSCIPILADDLFTNDEKKS
jgi:predicted PurR-regulated permease PerM